MHIRLRKKEKEYAQVHKNLLFNPMLSLKAKGLGSILECYSDNFEVCLSTLTDKSTDGEKAIKAACKELVLNNYLFRFQILNENSKFKTIWIFDSEFVDQNYKNEILNQFTKIYKVDELPKGHPVSNGVPFEDTLKSTTYNNITSTCVPSDLDYLKMMHQVELDKTKKPRAYTNTPKKKPTPYDTS